MSDILLKKYKFITGRIEGLILREKPDGTIEYVIATLHSDTKVGKLVNHTYQTEFVYPDIDSAWRDFKYLIK